VSRASLRGTGLSARIRPAPRSRTKMCLASFKSPQSCVIRARRARIHGVRATDARARAATIAENIRQIAATPQVDRCLLFAVHSRRVIRDS